jgi:hypothetical protein
MNNYQHNLNLSLELQRIVNEHLMMEDYPLDNQDAANEIIENGLDQPPAFDMPPVDFLGENGAGDITMGAGDFFQNDIEGTVMAGGTALPMMMRRGLNNKKQV